MNYICEDNIKELLKIDKQYKNKLLTPIIEKISNEKLINEVDISNELYLRFNLLNISKKIQAVNAKVYLKILCKYLNDVKECKQEVLKQQRLRELEQQRLKERQIIKEKTGKNIIIVQNKNVETKEQHEAKIQELRKRNKNSYGKLVKTPIIQLERILNEIINNRNIKYITINVEWSKEKIIICDNIQQLIDKYIKLERMNISINVDSLNIKILSYIDSNIYTIINNSSIVKIKMIENKVENILFNNISLEEVSQSFNILNTVLERLLNRKVNIITKEEKQSNKVTNTKTSCIDVKLKEIEDRYKYDNDNISKGTHASPRQHYRQGCIVHRKNGTTFERRGGIVKANTKAVSYVIK